MSNESTAQQNLIIKRGDSKTYTLYFKDENGVPINITGYTVFMTVKEKITDTDAEAKISKTITVHTAPTDGKTKISLSSADTNLIGNYFFDFQLKNTLGEIKTLLEGITTFEQDITQRTS